MTTNLKYYSFLQFDFSSITNEPPTKKVKTSNCAKATNGKLEANGHTNGVSNGVH